MLNYLRIAVGYDTADNCDGFGSLSRDTFLMVAAWATAVPSSPFWGSDGKPNRGDSPQHLKEGAIGRREGIKAIYKVSRSNLDTGLTLGTWILGLLIYCRTG